MNDKPTGKTRFRAHRTFWGKTLLVVQIQWNRTHLYLQDNNAQSVPHLLWEDARVEDMSEEEFNR